MSCCMQCPHCHEQTIKPYVDEAAEWQKQEARLRAEGAAEAVKAIASVFGVGLPTVKRWVSGASTPHPAVSKTMTAACKAEGAAEEREACLAELTVLEISSGENSHARRLVLREAQDAIRARGDKP